MIPKLYPKNETAFTTAGYGELTDATKCIVTEERNGEYALQMVYPVTGALYKEIQNDSLILAKPNIQHRPQPFRVYDISRPINGIVTVSAEHISYQTNSIPVFPFTAGSIAEAVSRMMSNSAVENPFTFSTTKTTSGTMTVSVPTSFRSLMAGSTGSLLDVYGTGEYLYDRWNISLQSQRGSDNGVLIEYGINLTDLKQEENIASLVTGVAPYWQNSNTIVTLPEKTIELTSDYSYPRVQTLDLSSEFEEAPTVEQLRTKAQSYLSSADLTTPKVNLTVSFVDLSQTDEYKDILAAVSNVMLCDVVTVRFAKLGVETKAKVIRTEFNVLKDRYESIELGEPRQSFTASQYQIIQEVAEKPSVDFMQKAIDNATDLITGNNGGHIIFRPKDKPQEMLIMDTDDVNTARNVWRYNLSGWGFSSTGVNGPFRLAATMDGALVADMITTGILNANIIRAGVLASANGVTTLNMSTGRLLFTLSSLGQLELWTGGLTFRNGNTHLGSFFVNTGGETEVRTNKLSLSKNDVPNTVAEYVSSSSTDINAYATTLKLKKGSTSNDVARYGSDGKVYVEADYIGARTGILLNGYQLNKKTVTISGQTIKYLEWT